METPKGLSYKITNPEYKLNQKDLQEAESLIKGINYDERTTRRRTAFIGDGYRYASEAVHKRWGLNYCFVELGHEETKIRYFSSSVNKQAGHVWWNKIKSDNNFIDNIIKETTSLLKLGELNRYLVFNDNFSKSELSKNIINYLNWTVKIHEFSQMWAGIDYLKEMVDHEVRGSWNGTADELDRFISSIYLPSSIPLPNAEERDLLKLVHLSGDDLNSQLEIHFNKYKHITVRNIDDPSLSYEYYLDRLRSLKIDSEYENINKKLSDFDNQIITADRLVNESNLPEKIKKSISFIRWFLFFRTEISDYFRITNGVFRPVFLALSKIFGVSFEEVLNMTYKEILDSLDMGLSDNQELRETISDRTKNGYGYLIITPPYKSFLVTGKEIDAVDIFFKKNTKTEQPNTIKGKSAFKGIVTSTARVIIDKSKANELKEGEILVTPMTSPEFFHVIKKCAGIITNEGGITTHAAIMAREFSLPCVTGTQIATEIIKTGDNITLDADTGIITINI